MSAIWLSFYEKKQMCKTTKEQSRLQYVNINHMHTEHPLPKRLMQVVIYHIQCTTLMLVYKSQQLHPSYLVPLLELPQTPYA